ncbi:FapA family protein [Chrysiogenes arsenatis]|uniref:FapA family protein n=1 Tax=Chrysiogenes arsenatis TaxID=309797 RepID=UPI000424869B|nr:FapA family protein [Chrysiogenes arsenatis]
MRIIDIRALRPGVRVGRNLYKDRTLLLAKGYLVDEALLRTIADRNLRNLRVFVDDGTICEFEKKSGLYYVDVVEQQHGSVKLDAGLVVNGYIDSHSRLLVAGEVNVKEDILPYSHLSAHGKLTVQGEIYGCCVNACEKIKLGNVGSEEHTRTLISLQEFSLQKLIMLRNLNAMKANKMAPLLTKLREPVAKVTQLGKKINLLPVETRTKLMAAYQKYIELNTERKKIDAQQELLQAKMEDVSQTPKIQCYGAIHPGVTFRIKDEVFIVKEPMHRSEFFLNEAGKIEHKKIRE